MTQFSKILLPVLMAAIILSSLFLITPAFAIEIINNEKGIMNIGGRIQKYAMLELVDDKTGDSERILLFVRDVRLALDGERNGNRFGLQIALGGEADDMLNRPGGASPEASKPITALLLDAWGDIRLTDNFSVRGGQFKMPYSRERLADGATLQFTNRSMVTRAFNLGRDTGVALHGNTNNIYGAFGIFTGGGINQRVRNIPVKLGFPLLVLRLGYNDLDDGIFDVKELDREKEGNAFYVNALYMKNSDVGHSNILAMRQHDRSFLLDSNWNQYYGTAAYGDEILLVGADYALQKKMGNNMLLTIGAEAGYGKYTGKDGSSDMTAGTLKAGILKSSFEAATRYSVLIPDEDTFATEKGIVQVITLALNYYFNDNFKILADLPIMLNAPIAFEGTAPKYNRIWMPGAMTNIERKTAITGRMVMQFSF